MATRAVRTELPLVLVFVARSTVCESKVGEFSKNRPSGLFCFDILNLRVTLLAIQGTVLSGQYKTSAVVRELRHRFELVVGMTPQTIGAQLAPVLVDMATQAVGAEAEESTGHIFVRLPRLEIFANECRIVTVAARQRRMLADQREPDCGVVELIATVGPMYQFKFATGMIVMAVKTGHIVDGYGQMMVTLFILKTIFYQRMTGEALVRRRSFAKFMTLGAVGNAFQLLMRCSQIARRELGQHSVGKKQPAHNR